MCEHHREILQKIQKIYRLRIFEKLSLINVQMTTKKNDTNLNDSVIFTLMSKGELSSKSLILKIKFATVFFLNERIDPDSPKCLSIS